MDSESSVIDAFSQLGLRLAVPPLSDAGVDVILDPAGIHMPVRLQRRALVDGDEARRLLRGSRPPGTLLLVVGDRVTAEARAHLLEGRAGYLDLRGRLAARTDRLVLDVEVSPRKGRSARTKAFSGPAGLEIAVALLLEPQSPVAVRALARRLGRAPSTVSDVLGQLRTEGLVDMRSSVVGPDLFWALADGWPSRRTPLLQVPDPSDEPLAAALRLGLHDVTHSTGWAMTGTTAALAHGAPIATTASQILDFYVPDEATFTRARTLLGVAPSSTTAGATIRVAPVPAAANRRLPGPAKGRMPGSGWPLAHPLFVALDLAQDEGRGRQILNEWTPDGGVRVW